MGAGTILQLDVSLAEDAGNSSLPTLTMVCNGVVGDRQTITLASGDNTCDAPPAASSGVVLIPENVPNVGGVNVCTLGYRTTGSTNMPLRGTGFSVITWDVVPSELIINAAFAGSAPTPEGSVEVVYF